MDRRTKARRILEQLDALYPAPPCPLDHADAFQLLVAVVLSAQCTDKKVNEVTPALFARAPDAHAMAAMSPDEILALIRPIGLAPTKSRRLAEMARLLVDRHGGVVPSSFDALEALPGVGHKSAGVVMSQAFGVPAFPVDTHIYRLAHRWGLSRGRTPDHVEDDLERVFPRAAWNRLHLQFIFFGREYCPALRHTPASCPICVWASPA